MSDEQNDLKQQVMNSPEVARLRKHHLDPKSSVLAGILACGYVDDENVVHNEYLIKEMGGTEEDLLAASGPFTGRMNAVIGNTLIKLGGVESRITLAKAIGGMATVDRLILMIALRRVSLGDLFQMQVTCPNCKRDNKFAVDLAALEIRSMRDPRVRTLETVLATGTKVNWHVMATPDEDWVYRKQKINDDTFTLMILARVDTIDGEALDREKGFAMAVDRIKQLTMRERNELRNAFDEHEGYLDDRVEFTCPKCEKEWKGTINTAQAGFFFPSATSRR
jgi:hypothetical protein